MDRWKKGAVSVATAVVVGLVTYLFGGSAPTAITFGGIVIILAAFPRKPKNKDANDS